VLLQAAVPMRPGEDHGPGASELAMLRAKRQMGAVNRRCQSSSLFWLQKSRPFPNSGLSPAQRPQMEDLAGDPFLTSKSQNVPGNLRVWRNTFHKNNFPISIPSGRPPPPGPCSICPQLRGHYH
jgi:hypothetical protein